MTFEELLECSADQLEKLTDQELLDILKPCLVLCPPIDIQIVNEAEAKIKLEKLQKKTEEKEKKKQERLLAKTNNVIEKKVKQKVSAADLLMVQQMIANTQKLIEQQQANKKL